jgi:hypothetical protein
MHAYLIQYSAAIGKDKTLVCKLTNDLLKNAIIVMSHTDTFIFFDNLMQKMRV